MNEKIKSRQDELQPEITPPVERQGTGTMFHVQPNGGVRTAMPTVPVACYDCIVLNFAPDDSE